MATVDPQEDPAGADGPLGHPTGYRWQEAGHGRPRPGDLRDRAQRGGAPPGGDGAAGGRPPGNAVHPNPGRGAGRRGQALPAEGHRPGPPGVHPLAELVGWRRRPRAQAAELPPAHPEEDGSPRPAFRALGPRRGRAGRPRGRLGLGAAQDQGRRRRPRGARSHRAGARRARRGRRGGGAFVREPPGRSRRCLPPELSAYDVLRNEWVVFTDETLPATGPATSEERES